MKKLLLIPLCFSLFFTSCSDDEEEEVIPPVSVLDADMRGEWTNTSIKRTYYNFGDEVMYEDSVLRNANFRFDGKRMTVTLPGSAEKDVWNYEFPNNTDSTYIQLHQDTTSTDYTVTSISDTVMIWEDEIRWAGFPEDVPDDQKTTSRYGVYKWKFVRKK
ncbi:hypothetical protein [Pontibacter rugosus]|uniref:Lipocalin-like domain-containing protein n=1 Tax=Pontibacter rugosus TaxID=1745966 RepID=A0ABW3SP70_9BACT